MWQLKLLAKIHIFDNHECPPHNAEFKLRGVNTDGFYRLYDKVP